MKIVTTAEDFVAALKNLNPEKKSAIPALTTVKVDGKTLTATNLDDWTITTFPGRISGSQPFLIPYRKVMDVLSGEKGKLTISYTSPKQIAGVSPSFKVNFSVNGCDYSLDTIDVTNFPQTPDPAEAVTSIDGKFFRTLLDRALFAVSQQESRYTLNGVRFSVDKGLAQVVATDGCRLALDTCEAEGEIAPVLIRFSALDFIRSRIKDSVSIGQKDKFLTLRTSDLTVISRILDGNFPAYEQVIPKVADRPVTVGVPSCSDLAGVLKRVSKCAEPDHHGVMFAVDGKLTISAESREAGKATAQCNADCSGGDATTKLSSVFVADFLKQIGDNSATLHIGKPDEAVLFKKDSYLYIVMPLRI